MMKPYSWFLAGALTVSSNLPCRADREPTRNDIPPSLASIQVVSVDDRVTRRAVANPTNQKVVSNENGIFLTYICTSTRQDQRNRWRLMRSVDGGSTFDIVYEEVAATKAPTLDTDSEGNLYLCRPDYSTRGPAAQQQGWFYKFSQTDNYADPRKVPIPRAMAGKYAAVWDESRRQIYFWVHNGWMSVLNSNGQLVRQSRILKYGPVAQLQYPLLCMSNEQVATPGSLYAGWTTWERDQPDGRPPSYWDIHAMRSPDGARTWQKLNGTPLNIPHIADHTGETDRISLDDEFESHTWLAAMLVAHGKQHFIYKHRAFQQGRQPSGTPTRQHYVRYDLDTGQRDIDLYPEVRGVKLAIRGSHCLLATRTADPDPTR